jgi:hypothetical protein
MESPGRGVGPPLALRCYRNRHPEQESPRFSELERGEYFLA